MYAGEAVAGDLRYEWVRMSLYESKLGGTSIESGRINKGRLDPILAFYSDDLAGACVFLMGEACKTEALFNDHEPPLVNIGCGEDVTIAELAGMVAEVVGFEGEIAFDADKPDGTRQKLLDVSRMNGLGWRQLVELREGVSLTYQNFINYERVTKR